MRQIRKGLTLSHTKPNLRKSSKSRKRQTKKLELLLPSTEEYIPLPRTWEEFQAVQEQYREHPMWDLCSLQEHYKWTEGWKWDPVLGHQPTDEMRLREWATHDYKQIDLEDAYFLSPLPERLPLTQCVTVFESPPRANPPVKRRRTLKIRLQTHINNRLRPRTSRQQPKPPTQTIPGTPNIEPEQASTTMTTRATKPEQTTEQVEDVELDYRVFNMFRPEQGESNAESAERTLQINKEYALRLKRQRDKIRQQRLQKLSQPSSTLHPIPLRLHWSPEPTINTQTNNAQEIHLQSDHSLYLNQYKPTLNTPMDIIYDTGAAISMMPAQYTHAWRNSRP
jgi:hypothetical protein